MTPHGWRVALAAGLGALVVPALAVQASTFAVDAGAIRGRRRPLSPRSRRGSLRS
jgi:hypothetical protein